MVEQDAAKWNIYTCTIVALYRDEAAPTPIRRFRGCTRMLRFHRQLHESHVISETLRLAIRDAKLEHHEEYAAYGC